MNAVELLKKFQATRCEEAFAELVHRYGSFVYSVANRRLGDRALAEDAAQIVFLRLAKNPPRAVSEGQFSAWLHRATINASIDLWRRESRRRRREEQSLMNDQPEGEAAQTWEAIAPVVDNAVQALPEQDKEAVLLRFFQAKSMREVAFALGISEDAAKMRVARAIDRLRKQLPPLTALTSLTLASLLEARAVESLPSGFIDRVAGPGILASAASGGLTSLNALNPMLMLLSKGKILVGALVVGVLGVATVLHFGRPDAADLNLSVQAEEQLGDSSSDFASSALAPLSVSNSLPASMGVRESALEKLKAELERLLDFPPIVNWYPPEELRRVLAKFEGQYEEALPILVRAGSRDDFATRRWALSGVKHLMHVCCEISGDEQRAHQLLLAARPVLAQAIRPGEPQLLQDAALFIYLPPRTYRPGTEPITPLISAEAAEDFRAALHLHTAKFDAFHIVDQIGMALNSSLLQAELFTPQMHSMLRGPNKDHQFLAAFALATWPGHKPTEVKQILRDELKTRSDASVRAARALGKLGADAADVVPDLLEYAKATERWGAGYSTAAYEAVFQIEPDLKMQMPVVVAELAVREEAHQAHIQTLQTKVREEEAAPQIRLHVRNLALEARVILTDLGNHPKEGEILDQLAQFKGSSGDYASAEDVERLSSALRTIYPQFESVWRKDLIRHYPFLDRTFSTNSRAGRPE